MPVVRMRKRSYDRDLICAVSQFWKMLPEQYSWNLCLDCIEFMGSSVSSASLVSPPPEFLSSLLFKTMGVDTGASVDIPMMGISK